MKERVWSQRYVVSTFLVNPQKRLGLYALLNVLQDAAWLHATHLGHGHEDMVRSKAIWVLTRQHVAMGSWPAWGSEIEVRTWIRPFTGIFANRDFEVFEKGEKIGEATTSWLIMDSQTRKPRRTDPTTFDVEVRKDYQVSLETAKLPPLEAPADLARFKVRNSDLDMNLHVNNTRYSQWILDSVPPESHAAARLDEYEICFLAETRSGDEVVIQTAAESEREGKRLVSYQGMRESDRKVVFTARLLVSASSADDGSAA